MKTCLFLLLAISRFAVAQDIALIDRHFKNPMSVTKKLTVEQLSGKQFPVYIADLDSVIRLTETLSEYINAGIVHEPDMQIFQVGSSHFAINTERKGVYNMYSIFLSTKAGNVGASIELVKRGDGNKKAVQRLQVFLDYLKNNRHMITMKKDAGD